jgi:hypothetical protein
MLPAIPDTKKDFVFIIILFRVRLKINKKFDLTKFFIT